MVMTHTTVRLFCGNDERVTRPLIFLSSIIVIYILYPWDLYFSESHDHTNGDLHRPELRNGRKLAYNTPENTQITENDFCWNTKTASIWCYNVHLKIDNTSYLEYLSVWKLSLNVILVWYQMTDLYIQLQINPVVNVRLYAKIFLTNISGQSWSGHQYLICHCQVVIHRGGQSSWTHTDHWTKP